MPLERVIVGDAREFLWPIKSDPQVVSAQFRALSKGTLYDFVRFVATHHVAGNIWPDMRSTGAGDYEGSGRLLKVVMHQAPTEIVRDVVHHYQEQIGPVHPTSEGPDQLRSDLRECRIEFVRKLGDDDLMQRVEGFLNN